MRSYQRLARDARLAGCKRFVEVLHRRAGKDRKWLALTLEEALKTKGVYYHVFPNLKQARRDVWDNIVQERINGEIHSFPMLDMFPKELIVNKNEAEMQLTFANGSIWQLMGADTEEAVHSLRGANPIGIIFSEYAHMREDAWTTLMPVLAENGGWAAFIYTPNGPNHGERLYNFAKAEPGWFSLLRTVDDTRRDAEGEDGSRIIPELEIAEQRRAGVREDVIQEEYYCSFLGYQNRTIYGEVMATAEADGRICRIPYITQLPVAVRFDLGHGDKMASWFYQISGPNVHFIDYWEDTRKDMHDWVRIAREHKPYTYAKIWLPWDGRGHMDYLIEVQFKNVNVYQRPVSVSAEIDVIRREFRRFSFDSVRCAVGIDHLRQYSHEWNDDTQSYKDTAKHDEHSHAADALRSGGADFAYIPFTPFGLQSEVKVESSFDPREPYRV
jgi:DUF971 family protein